MSNQNDYIRINLSIEIPVHTAEKTVEKLQEFAANLSQLPKQIEAPKEQLLEDDVAQAIKHVGQKAHADLKAEEELEQLEEANRIMRQKQLAEARKKYNLNVIQAYRLYRRIRPECDRDYPAYKAVSLHLDWPVSAAQHAVASRKRIIKAYLKHRNNKTIMRLAYEGWTNKAIGSFLGMHEKTVAKIFRELRKGFKV